jgi:hypothetical protein
VTLACTTMYTSFRPKHFAAPPATNRERQQTSGEAVPQQVRLFFCAFYQKAPNRVAVATFTALATAHRTAQPA